VYIPRRCHNVLPQAVCLELLESARTKGRGYGQRRNASWSSTWWGAQKDLTGRGVHEDLGLVFATGLYIPCLPVVAAG